MDFDLTKELEEKTKPVERQSVLGRAGERKTEWKRAAKGKGEKKRERAKKKKASSRETNVVGTKGGQGRGGGREGRKVKEKSGKAKE